MRVVELDVDHVLDVVAGGCELTAGGGEPSCCARAVRLRSRGRESSSDEACDQKDSQESKASPLHKYLPLGCDRERTYKIREARESRCVKEAVTVSRNPCARTCPRAWVRRAPAPSPLRRQALAVAPRDPGAVRDNPPGSA